MKELQEIVTAKINDMIENGAVEEIINTKIEAAIKDSIESSTRSYSTFSKLLTEKFEVSMQTAVKNVELPCYNKFINQIILDKFTGILQTNGAQHLAKLVEETIPPIAKKAKFSDIMDAIRTELSDAYLENGNTEIEISAEYSDSNNAIYLTIPDEYSNDLKISFYNHKRENEESGWYIGYINDEGRYITRKSTSVANTCLSGITAVLFRYYAMGTRFEGTVDDFYSIDLID